MLISTLLRDIPFSQYWRSDATESIKLGEQIAIGILREQKASYNEPFSGFSLTKFDGTQITV